MRVMVAGGTIVVVVVDGGVVVLTGTLAAVALASASAAWASATSCAAASTSLCAVLTALAAEVTDSRGATSSAPAVVTSPTVAGRCYRVLGRGRGSRARRVRRRGHARRVVVTAARRGQTASRPDHRSPLAREDDAGDRRRRRPHRSGGGERTGERPSIARRIDEYVGLVPDERGASGRAEHGYRDVAVSSPARSSCISCRTSSGW
jgi:hypothetical protein